MNNGLLIAAFVCACIEIIISLLSILLPTIYVWMSFASIVVGLSVPFLLFLGILKKDKK